MSPLHYFSFVCPGSIHFRSHLVFKLCRDFTPRPLDSLRC
jgi:hypothetical protein